MLRLIKQFINGTKGQALPLVLCLLAIGGLTIAVSLNYTTTSLKGSQIIEQQTKGIYAAAAGVEHSLWSLAKGVSPLPQLSENISGMEVSMQSAYAGNFTLYLGDLIEPRGHSDYLSVSGNMTLVGGNTYQYTITVTRQEVATGIIKLTEVGARIPVGYSYNGSPGGLSTGEPTETLDGQGAYLLSWDLPNIWITDEDNVKTQTFEITGTGSQGGDYAWVAALSNDIDVVGEVTGALWEITATATRPQDGRTMATVVADIMISGGSIYIVSWQISN